MAPVHYRPPTPLIARSSLIAPSSPIQTSAWIPRKLFLQLFVGTVCIFILTVLFWKSPRFFRFFTKNKVLREGNTTTARYARTWYGWVSFQRHEANKRRLQSCMAKLDRMTAWRSSKADFQWVWWDPGQKELGTYQERGKRWLLKWVRSYGFTTADTIWNPGSPSSHNTRIDSGLAAVSSPFAAGALSPPDAPRPVVIYSRRSTLTNISLQEGFGGTSSTEGFRLRRANIFTQFRSNTSSHVVPHARDRFTPLEQLSLSQRSNRLTLKSAACSPLLPNSCSMPCLSQFGYFSGRPHGSTNVACRTSKRGRSEDLAREFLPLLRRSRKYQVWSARMGLQTLKCIGQSTHTLPKGPPGSPKSALLGGSSFASAASNFAFQYRRKPKQTSASDVSELFLCSSVQDYHVEGPVLLNRYKGKAATQRWQSDPSPNFQSTSSHPPTLPGCLKDPQVDQPTSALICGNKCKNSRHPVPKGASTERKQHCIVQAKDWSNWEVRLIDNLDRRLEWLSTQLSPGKRPYHFALLANHWLNTETWIVYDPISRVSIDMRRRLGDPRFNVPYPAPTWAPNPKYPKACHRPAHTPKIDSWRAAMNRQRRTTGLKEFIKGIELYDSSAEDPPDGKVDPASWILRRPPQGFGLSARQRDKYYEGGIGWQEKLSEWEKIRRGYRVRKAVYEGRVNRTRAKEIAYGISRYYREATSRLFRSNANDYFREGEELSVDESS
ncbi:hypothetical protein BDW59DRAFT_164448 [Aspergillus cavernicola]|uniref:AP2/ERF domain-containing protein n=1 Tax=Aspergillus cavernicola TaxID=176166 RepID=A0ABR4HZH7_9EURO